MKKVILFGDLPLATEVCKVLIANKVELIGAVIGNENIHNYDPFESPSLYEYCKKNKVPIFNTYNLNRIFKKHELDLGITCRFSKVLRKETLDLFKDGVLNFHGGLIPEFGGLYSSCHTILEESKIGGGTLHYIDEEIDEGKIIKRLEFPIKETDTSYSIYCKTQKALLEGFVKLLPMLINGNVETKTVGELIQEGYKKKYFNKKSLKGKKEVSLTDEPGVIVKKVRAFDFPGKEPAFVKLNGQKIYLRLNFNG